MTDRIHALTVVLEHPTRDDDIQATVEAIKQLRGVLEVRLHVANFDTYAAEERARRDLGQKIWAILYPEQRG